MYDISTHDLTRRSTISADNQIMNGLFQLTTSQGGRHLEIWHLCIEGNFNSRPHKEVDIEPFLCHYWIAYFNSRPHKEVDWAESPDCCSKDISTHDLTRRSTVRMTRPRFSSRNFNSRPHKEVDGSPLITSVLISPFQLTTSQGGRRSPPRMQSALHDISTHDLTRRSTCTCYTSYGKPSEFQLTTSQGGRLKEVPHLQPSLYFNSRPHKEVDITQAFRSLQRKHFNSRPHKEVDTKHERRVLQVWYFNSRPHKEVDSISPNRTEKTVRISTHDLTRRSTSCCIPSITVLIISTHDLTRRSTTVFADPPNCTLFQLTTSQGGRLLPYRLNPTALHFNSRPHKEVDQRLF